MNEVLQFLNTYIAPLGWKLIGAIVVWIIGGWVIRLASKALSKSLSKRKEVDATLAKYAENGANVALRILLVILILGILGFETTSFAALLAAAGVAIGAAWGGLLANFAAGIFLVFLRPFKVGDFVNVNGVSGSVVEIGLFVTALNTPDNVRIYVGNNSIFSANIQNFSANAYRRVELTMQLAHGVDPLEAIQRLREKVNAIPNVLETPATEIDILSFNERGTVLMVRPYCATANYGQVFFDTNRAILAALAEGGYSVPEQRVAVRNLP